jgi:hypothetical protein
MRPKIYLETTIPSYLTAWPSRDLIRAAHQQITLEWWKFRRADFDLHVSEFVLLEVGKGDPVAAAERLESLKDIPVLDASSEAQKLTAELIRRVPLPPKAALDASHIGIAVVSGMDFLLTWNCSHIANASLRSRIDDICREMGYSPITICTPIELLKR